MTQARASSRQSAISRSVLKVMGIFSGVQAAGILCSIIRTKLVAIWIGATGVGLFGIFSAAVELIGSLAQMGMNTSATRHIAAATAPSRRLSIIVATRRAGLLAGLLAAIATFAYAPLLSRWSFGSPDFAPSFRLLSIIVLLAPISGAESGIMQGLGRYRTIARATLCGSATGLALSVPVFYFMGAGGIAPSMVIYSVATAAFIIAMRPRRKSVAPGVAAPSASAVRGEYGRLLSLGAYITISFAASYVASWLFIVWLNRTADTETVGYFQAGFTITNRYAGIIFSALAMEYYPRLSSVSVSPWRTAVFVSHETILLMSMFIPAVAAFIACAPVIVSVLYAGSFSVITPMISISAIGAVFRALSFCMAYVILARGDGRIYIVTEILSAIIYLAAGIICFTLWGITGMGVAYLIWYVCYTASVYTVYRRRYGLHLNRRALRFSAMAAGSGCVALALVSCIPHPWAGHLLAGALAAVWAMIILPKLLSKHRNVTH